MTIYKTVGSNDLFRTFSQVVVSLSASFTLVCLFGGLKLVFEKEAYTSGNLEGDIVNSNSYFRDTFFGSTAICFFTADNLHRIDFL